MWHAWVTDRLLGESEKKGRGVTHRISWEDNIEMDLTETW